MKGSQRVLFWSLTIFLLLLIAGVILPTLGMSMAIIRALPLGWLNFLRRTVPEVTVNWSGIGMVILCSALILLCLHSLLSALTQKSFRVRWSASIFASLWLLFGLIIAVTGLSRTIQFLQNEKWYEPRSGYGDLRMASMHARMALSDSEGNLRILKQLLLDSSGWRPFWEEFEFLVCSLEPSKSPCVIVIPRKPKVRESIGFSIVTNSDSEDSIPIAKLQERLAKLSTPMPP